MTTRFIPTKKTLAQNAEYVGLPGELVVIPAEGVAVHDGFTAGGSVVRSESTYARNYIRNGQFAVQQNGIQWLGISGNTYIADGWYMQQGGGNSANVAIGNIPGESTRANKQLVITAIPAGASDSYTILAQRIPDARFFSGRRIYIEFQAYSSKDRSIAVEVFTNHDGVGGANVLAGRVDLKTGRQRFELSVDVPEITPSDTFGANNHFGIYFWLDAGGDYNGRTGGLAPETAQFTTRITDIALKVESAPYLDRTLDEEEREVRRFFEVNTDTVPLASGAMSAYSTTVYARVPFAVPKWKAGATMSITTSFMAGTPTAPNVYKAGFNVLGTANSAVSAARLTGFTANAEIAPGATP